MVTYTSNRSFRLISDKSARSRRRFKIFRCLFVGLLAFVLPLLYLPASDPLAAGLIPSSETFAEALPGSIQIRRTIRPFSAVAADRTVAAAAAYDPARVFEIETSIQGIPLTSAEPADIVLVLDVSQSMATFLQDTSTTRLKAMKNAASMFIMETIAADAGHRIALVTYSGSPDSAAWNDAWIHYAFDDWQGKPAFINQLELLTAVTLLDLHDGSNIEAGLLRSADALDASPSANKVVILMSDGAANFYYDDAGLTAGSGSGSDPAARAPVLAAARNLHDRHDVRIFTVGLIDGDTSAEEIALVLHPDGDDAYTECYYPVSSADELASLFVDLAAVIDSIAHGAIFTDKIASGFRRIEGSLSGDMGSGSAIGISTNAGHAGSDSDLIWSIGSIGSRLQTIRYLVVAQDPLYGAVFASDPVTLDFTAAAGNDRYEADFYRHPASPGHKQLQAERTVLLVNPLVRDDRFYQMKAGDTLRTSPHTGLTGEIRHEVRTAAKTSSILSYPGLLANDPAAWRQTMVGDWITGGVEAQLVADSHSGSGSLTLNPDGQFRYEAAADSAGVHRFSYDLISRVQRPDGSILELSSRAAVEIQVEAATSDPTPEDPANPAATPPAITPALPGGSEQPDFADADQGSSGTRNRPTADPTHQTVPKVGEVYDFWLPLRQLFGR